MPLVNPYGELEYSNEFPLLLAILFGLGIVLLGLSVYLLLNRKNLDSPAHRIFPSWSFQAAYPAFFLLLPFVMLVSTMLFIPDDWVGRAPKPKATEQVRPEEPQREFLDPDSMARGR